MRPTYWKHRDRHGKIALVKPTAMMMVTVQVRNFDAAVAWYRDVLGLSVLARGLPLRGRTGPHSVPQGLDWILYPGGRRRRLSRAMW